MTATGRSTQRWARRATLKQYTGTIEGWAKRALRLTYACVIRIANVVGVLKRVKHTYGQPKTFRVFYSPEFISKDLRSVGLYE